MTIVIYTAADTYLNVDQGGAQNLNTFPEKFLTNSSQNQTLYPKFSTDTWSKSAFLHAKPDPNTEQK